MMLSLRSLICEVNMVKTKLAEMFIFLVFLVQNRRKKLRRQHISSASLVSAMLTSQMRDLSESITSS